MGVLSERKINIYLVGWQDVGKTVNVTAHFSNPILAKEGGSEISINFEKSKKYEPKHLEQMRNTFFVQAINSIRKNN